MVNTDPASLRKPFILGLIILILSAGPAIGKTKHEALHNNHEIVAKHECGQNNYFAITKDNYGGYSYGKWQISTERRGGLPSTFDFFLKYLKKHSPKAHTTLMVAGGQPSAYRGDKEFIAVWNTLVSHEYFRTAYDQFLLNDQIIPVYDRLDATNNTAYLKLTDWGTSDNAVQAAIKSTIVQHGMGGAFKMFVHVMDVNQPKTKADFIMCLYKHRQARFPMYKARYVAEYADLKTYLESGESKIAQVVEKPVDTRNMFTRLKQKIKTYLG